MEGIFCLYVLVYCFFYKNIIVNFYLNKWLIWRNNKIIYWVIIIIMWRGLKIVRGFFGRV